MIIHEPTRPLLLPHGSFRVRVLLAMLRHHWFIRLRWVMAFVALVLLVADRMYEPSFSRPAALMVCIALLAAVNLLWTLLATRIIETFQAIDNLPAAYLRRVVAFVNAQMTVDLLLLTAILRYTGGIENPMAIFYLFHMLIAALLLPPLNALLQGAWAVLLYGGLVLGECLGWITPHYPFVASVAYATLYTDWVYVLAGVGVLGAGVTGTLYFTLQISSRLDEQEHELFEANQAWQRSRDAVQYLQERRARFMRTAAHQLKSPLTGIEMLAGLIRDKVVHGDKLQETASRIIKRCREGIIQVAELLTLERVEQAAPARHQSAATDVVQILQRVTAQFADQARAKGVQLALETCNCQDVVAAVDARDLEDCVANLVDNAVKYTPSGGAVQVAADCDHRKISVSVKDNGMGIAKESLDSIFEPFRRGNEALAASIPGSGLGLAIVHEVVIQAGGRINVRSEVGSGSEFVITLPRRAQSGSGAASTGVGTAETGARTMANSFA